MSILFGLTNLGISTVGVFGAIINGLFGVLYGVMTAGAIVFTAIILIQRFYSNLLGNEGYLHFTLPVTTNAHIANKVISAGVWMILGMVAAGLSALILLLFMVTPAELMEELNWVLSELNGQLGAARIVIAILEALVLMIVALGEAAVKVYAAISMGQLLENHRILGAIGSYVGFAAIECILAGILNHFVPVYKITELNADGFTIFQIEMLVTLLVTALLAAIYWFISHRILDRRLNLQ